MTKTSSTTVIVCTTCRMTNTAKTDHPDGDKLLSLLSEADLPVEVELQGVECLSACDKSCSLVITGGDDRWSYIYGDLNPAVHFEDVVNGIKAYAETDDGVVPWRERPIVFRKQSIARIPPRSA